MRLDCGYRMDFVVEERLVLELKARRASIGRAQSSAADLPQAERPQDRIII
jgi:hypothetical protein